MRYFQKFPLILYTMNETVGDKSQAIIRAVPNMTLKFDMSYAQGDYDWYRISERDRPDTLAAQWYGTSQYTWVVLLSNNMKDLYDWPLTDLEFNHYMNRKYESATGARDGVDISRELIYEYRCTDILTGVEFVVDENFYTTHQFNKRSVTQYEYEYKLNDQKLDIRRLNTETFNSFVSQFEILVKQ